MLGGLRERRTLFTREEGIYGQFEQDVLEVLGEDIKKSDEVAAAFWGSLANVEWRHHTYNPKGEPEVFYSFRAAGDLIAAIREEGTYIDWYCCAPYGVVNTSISEKLFVKGWVGYSMQEAI